MTSKGEQLFAFGLAVILLLVGIICYAAIPEKVPEEPVRIMFKATAGSVLFSHNTHASEAGYGLYCEDCHHTGDIVACGECHYSDTEVTRADAFHYNCKGCHESYEAGPIECGACHVMR